MQTDRVVDQIIGTIKTLVFTGGAFFNLVDALTLVKDVNFKGERPKQTTRILVIVTASPFDAVRVDEEGQNLIKRLPHCRARI